MKILSLMGSPRKRGNTAKVLGWVEEELAKGGHELERVVLSDYEIHGCLGCGTCQKNLEEPGCVQKDDTDSVLRKIIEADRVVYATPLYCWGFTSQMKTLIDRQYCLVKGYGTEDFRSLVEGKRTALLVTCAGPVEENADLIQKMFNRVNGYARCKVLCKYVIPFCTVPEDLGPEQQEEARKMAREILS
ncbi:MAG: flavodoxin family protein [Deltaproteobacteria bacterium]|nr:flavodoxin family protein [Deltaproteobacteria bacterium]